MEMKHVISTGLTRVIALLASLALAITGVYIALHAVVLLPGATLAWNGITTGIELSALQPGERARWVLFGALTSAAGVLAAWISLPRMRHARRVFALRDALETPGVSSRVTISERSVQVMVIHAARAEEGVRDIRCDARLTRKGWQIRCDLSVWYGTAIPTLLPHLEDAISRTLTHHTGIAICDLAIDTHYEAIDAA